MACRCCRHRNEAEVAIDALDGRRRFACACTIGPVGTAGWASAGHCACSVACACAIGCTCVIGPFCVTGCTCVIASARVVGRA
ncbi:MAG TPA: hypothetical protein VGF27_11010 [Pseudoduganella sp.]